MSTKWNKDKIDKLLQEGEIVLVSPIFSQEQTCPVCEKKFTVQRVRMSAQRVARRDTDFCIHYEGVNPLMYSIWVCPECHFAATDQHFRTELSDFQLDRLRKGLSLFKGTEPDFSTPTDWATVLRGYELAIRSGQIYHMKASQLAVLFLRAAWVCRFAEKPDQEKQFIKEAVALYQQAYEKESTGGLTGEPKLLYLIGELHRRAGNPKEAVMWFSRAVRHPGVKQNAEIERLARDQWLTAKEEAKAMELGDNPNNQEETSPEGEEAAQGIDSNTPPPGGDPTSEPEEDETFPKYANRPKVNMMATIYQDQNNWLQSLTNRAHESHRVILEKTAIVRAVLDAAGSLEVPSEALSGEKTLRDYLVKVLKEKTK